MFWNEKTLNGGIMQFMWYGHHSSMVFFFIMTCVNVQITMLFSRFANKINLDISHLQNTLF